jgi:type IV pilus secretin PilQ/predicted competence protein
MHMAKRMDTKMPHTYALHSPVLSKNSPDQNITNSTNPSGRALTIALTAVLLSWTAASSADPAFPDISSLPKTVQVPDPQTGGVPNLKNMLKVVPLSISIPVADTNATGTTQPPVYAPMAQEKIAAGTTSIAQVLGSTTNGTITKAYTITHLRASEVQNLIADPAAPLLSRETSTVIVEARSNTLVLKGTEAEHQLIENLIRRVDVPVKQILVEVKIVSADEYFGKSLGAKFGITSSHLLNVATPRNSGTQVAGTLNELSNIANTGTSAFANMVNLPATNSLTAAAPSSFSFGFYKLPAGINIGLEISALEEAGHTKVLSSPKLVLSNFKPGLLSSGQRIPYSRPSIIQGVNTTEFVDAKVSVAVTALVSPDGSISMDLTLTDDSVGSLSSIGPTINTNQVSSTISLKSGETLLLGGFHSSSEVADSNKTPFFGDISIVGNLFKSRSNNSIKRELLFIITPTVIDANNQGT